MQPQTRRVFLGQAAGVAAATLAGTRLNRAAASANERIRLGVMGLGIRGPMVAEYFARTPGVEVVTMSDCDTRRFEKPAKLIEDVQKKRPQLVQDYRRMLDDKSIDALLVATPDHWHALPTIQACQAGKDVYVEKPVSHSMWEGRQMVNAARKYNRVVQVGLQSRSGLDLHEAIQAIRDGKIGDVHYVRVLNLKHRDPIGKKADTPVPEGVDYDMWVGPAPMKPFNPNRFHYNWHWFWDFSGGDIINDAVHQIDIGRWVVNQRYPTMVVSTGGKHHWDDDQETPDTQVATYTFDHLTMVFELTLWTPYMTKTDWQKRDDDPLPDWRWNGLRAEAYGSKGMVQLGRQGDGYEIFDAEGKPIASVPAPAPHMRHVANFCECIRTRSRPACDIEEGHLSTVLCHLGNISYRLGGRPVKIDPATETFGDDAEANRFVKRTYRAPYVIPDQV